MQNFVNVLALVEDFENPALVSRAFAFFTDQFDVSEELHLDRDRPISLTDFAPASGNIEREAAGVVAARLRLARCRKHIAYVIEPALAQGQWVLCDRFTDATFAYQGWGRGIDLTKLETLESWVQGQLQPDLTLYFDVPTEVARERIEATRTRDRFEQEQQAFFERVRNGYLDRAARHPHRIRILDSQRPLTDIQKELESILIRI